MSALLHTHHTSLTDTEVPPLAAGRALAGLSLSMLLASLGTSGANVALPTFVKVFGASFQAVQWIVLAYLLAVTTMIVGAGRLGDLIGRRRLLQLGIALFTGASLASGLAPSLGALIAARAIQGMGAAVMLALSMAFVSDAVPPDRVGRAMGLLGTMSAVGTALGPSLGGMLLTFPGWRALFLINVPVGVGAFWLVRRALPERRARHLADRSFDVAGTALLALSLGAFALALTVSREGFSRASAGLLVTAGLGASAFVRQQARVRVPLVPPSVLADRPLMMSLVSNALVACVMMSTLIVGPFYLTRALGLAPAAMGLAMTVGPVLTALAGIPAGRFVDARGAHRVTLVGLSAMALGSGLLALIPERFGVAGYIGSVFFLTVGYSIFQAANNTAVMAAATKDERGVVAGVLSLSRNLGLVTGASLMGAVFALASGATKITAAHPDAVARGMRITFLVAVALVAVAFALSMSRRIGRHGLAALVLFTLWAGTANGQAPRRETQSTGSQLTVVSPLVPYPTAAAGWGPQIGRNLFLSRWAEDWAVRRAAGDAPGPEGRSGRRSRFPYNERRS